MDCPSTKSLINGTDPVGSGILGTGFTTVDEGRTSPANLVRIVTCAIPIGISADYALEIIAVIVDATLPKYFSLIVMSPKVSSIGWFYLETRFSSTPSLNLHLLFPSTIWGFFRALRSTRALLTPDIDV